MAARTLFVGDVHSCADELRDLVDLARPSRVILVGDVFNKGPKPEETWALVKSLRAEAVLGNHDALVIAQPVVKGVRRVPAEALPWLRALPLFIRGKGGPSGRWVCVHGGLHPKLHSPGTTRKMAINMRRWPDDGSTGNKFWWQLYDGRRLAIYGHDAVRGLQDHRPRTLGLDSGCVYGGRLSGYLLEDDAVLSVPARGAYRPTSPPRPGDAP